MALKGEQAYVKLRLIERIGQGRSFRVSHSKRKTSCQKSNIFEETLEYILPPHELKLRALETSLCCTTVGIKSNVLSRCIVNLNGIIEALVKGQDNPTITEWYNLP